MPFTKTQSVLKKLLPNWCFALLYKLACHGYITWFKYKNKISDELCYLLSYIYFTLKRDLSNLKRVKTIYSIHRYAMVRRAGLLVTYDIADEIEKRNLEGIFVECGVAKGGSSALMALVARDNRSNRMVWLFDSFEGLPEPTVEDESVINKNPGRDKGSGTVYQGYCLGTYEEVSDLLFSKLGLNKETISMVRGWFQDTLPKYKDKIGAISFLRLDADWYESTKCCLENLYDNVISGGYILIDDYDFPGCRKAVHEFLEKEGVTVKYITIGNRGGAYFVKP